MFPIPPALFPAARILIRPQPCALLTGAGFVYDPRGEGFGYEPSYLFDLPEIDGLLVIQRDTTVTADRPVWFCQRMDADGDCEPFPAAGTNQSYYVNPANLLTALRRAGWLPG